VVAGASVANARGPAVFGEYRWGRVETRTGRRRPDSEHVTASVPAIISRETFDAAQCARRQRDPVTGDGRHRHTTQLLGGLLRCRCGEGYQLETSGNRTAAGEIRRYYQCRAFCRVGKSACAGFRVRTKVLEDALLEHLTRQFDGDHVRAALLAYTAVQEAERRALADQVGKCQAELAEADRRIRRWLEAFEQGADLAEVGTERLAQLRVERAAIVSRLGELGSQSKPPPPFLYRPSAVEALQTRLRVAFASEDRNVMRGLLNTIVERVVIDRGEVVVHYDLGGLVAVLAERGRQPGLGATGAKVRTDVHRWRTP
jgi:site-specific DNA recombinase